jgi:isopentenyl phosphate kinase
VPTVLKLGGSVVTQKDQRETVDEAALSRAATAVGDALAADRAGRADLVVVHGGGSFGHHHAAAHGVSDDDGTHDVAAAGAIHGAMRQLNDAVLDALRGEGVSAIPVQPLSVAHRDPDGRLSLPAGQIAAMLDEGFTPVLHGDLVAHEGNGLSVLSGDEIVVSLADSLSADRVGLCSTVPGVLDENGAVVDDIDSFGAVADALGESDATDVTGGMAGKVRALLDLPVPSSIFDLPALPEFLRGGSPGTTVLGADVDRGESR